jgi:hypothetical protein
MVYARISALKMTSCACPELGASTLVHLPPSNILFSFSGFKISRRQELEEDGSSTTFLTLGPQAGKIFKEATRTLNTHRMEEVAKLIPVITKAQQQQHTVDEDSTEEEGGSD